MGESISTGVDLLDRRLGGGIPTGSVLAVSSRPASQVELFLYQLAATRDMRYISFDQTDEMVANNFEETVNRPVELEVRHLGGETPIEHAIGHVHNLPADTNVLVDPHTVLEANSRTVLTEFVTELRREVEDSGSIAILNCPEGRDVPPLRDTTERLVDIVFQLETFVVGAQVETRLAVPKFRGGQALTDIIKLRLTDEIEIDTSRDI